MKNYYFFVVSFFVSSMAFGQQETERQVKELKPIKSEATGSKQLTAVPDSLENESIAHLDALITAIDNKVAYVNNDQTMREKALADGWFDKMAANRKRAVARKEALIARTTTK